MSKTQKEIGGYLELERFSGSLYHDNALALSSGRACLAYLIEQRHIDKMLLNALLPHWFLALARKNGQASYLFRLWG